MEGRAGGVPVEYSTVFGIVCVFFLGRGGGGGGWVEKSGSMFQESLFICGCSC